MKYKYLIEDGVIVKGPSDESITYKHTENQEVIKFDIDVNNPPSWVVSKNGKFKGFHPKRDLKWDHAKGHPVLKTQTEKNKEKKTKEKKELKIQLLDLKMKINAGNDLGIDMTEEEDRIISLKAEYDKK
jgi:putative cell wall-binding protein